VLLVEDGDLAAEIAGAILRRAGLAFDRVEDGVAAVEAVQRTPYGLILMDCQLPRLDGYRATRRIRELESRGALASRGRTLRILALTADTGERDVALASAAGMDGHVSKPVDATLLMSAIRAQLARFDGDHGD
jgi:CheY-like chemotaxis protein